MGKPLDERLRDAYPETPASFDQRMHDVLGHLPARKMHYIFKPAAAIVLAAVLLMGSLAYAITQSALLQAIFRGNDPSPEAQLLVTESGQTAEKDGVTLTIDEYLLDGVDLYVNWTVTSTRNETLLLTVSDLDVPAEGTASTAYSEFDWGMGDSILLDEAHTTFSAVSRFHFTEAAPTDAFDVGLTVVLMQPKLDIVDLEDVDSFHDTPKLISRDVENGFKLVSAVSDLQFDDDGYGSSWSNHLYDNMDESTFDNIISALEEQGYAAEEVRLPIQFSIQPDTENYVHTEIIGSGIYHFDKFTLTVQQADFTAAGTHIRYKITLRDQSLSTKLLVDDLLYEVYPNGQQQTQGWTSTMTSRGNGVYTFEIDAAATSSTPTWLRLVASNSTCSRFYDQYSVEIKLRKAK